MAKATERQIKYISSLMKKIRVGTVVRTAGKVFLVTPNSIKVAPADCCDLSKFCDFSKFVEIDVKDLSRQEAASIIDALKETELMIRMELRTLAGVNIEEFIKEQEENEGGAF